MSQSNDDFLQIRARSVAEGIPPHPEIAAQMHNSASQPAAPEPSNDAYTVQNEQNGQNVESESEVNLFEQLAQSMDEEYLASSSANRQDVSNRPDETPYEESAYQRAQREAQPPEPTTTGSVPVEPPPTENELRLSLDEWKKLQAEARAQQPTPQETQAPDYEKLRQQAVDHLSTNMYALTEEQNEQLISDPGQVFPKLAAQMHVAMQTELARQFAQVLPALIQDNMTRITRAQQLETEFFSKYPQLNNPEYKQTVAESIQMVRQLNPNATREQVMADGGALAALRLRDKLKAPPAPQPRPFTPAQAGVPSQGSVPIEGSGNVFADMAMDPNW